LSRLDPVLACVAALLLALLLLATVRTSEDERGVYRLRGPGFEVIYLPDQEAPAAWLYVAGHLIGYHRSERPATPDPRPTPTPVVTPRPRRGPVELEQANVGRTFNHLQHALP
jgi:hypothetical protein